MWRDALFERLFLAISAPSPLLFSTLASNVIEAEKQAAAAPVCGHAISRGFLAAADQSA
jgi:hypothetical protein